MSDTPFDPSRPPAPPQFSPPAAPPAAAAVGDSSPARDAIMALRSEIGKVVVGQEGLHPLNVAAAEASGARRRDQGGRTSVIASASGLDDGQGAAFCGRGGTPLPRRRRHAASHTPAR